MMMKIRVRKELKMNLSTNGNTCSKLLIIKELIFHENLNIYLFKHYFEL